MLLTIQFPFTDLRPFVNDSTFMLKNPSWASPIPNRDFVRSFGTLKRRPRGGLSGWIGETIVCESEKAIRFEHLPSYKSANKISKSISFKIAFRRFYSDSLALAKFEVGIATANPQHFSFSGKQTDEFLSHLLHLKVRFPNPIGEPRYSYLWQAGKELARLYFLSSTLTNSLTANTELLKESWVQSGSPLFYVSYDKNKEAFNFPYWGKSLTNHVLSEATLSHYLVPIKDQKLRMWAVGESWPSEEIRDLRVYLLRLYAEQACFRHVLNSLSTGKLEIPPRSVASDTLQHYLNNATRRMDRLKKNSYNKMKFDVSEIAYEVEDMISAGERESLIQALTIIDVRKNIIKKVEERISNVTFVNKQEIIMGEKNTGDTINVEKAGVVGRYAHANTVNFYDVWSKESDTLDLNALAVELATLQMKMKDVAEEPEQFQTLVYIASAEKSASVGDGPKTLEYLSKVGKWAFDFATKVGASLTAAAIKTALGI